MKHTSILGGLVYTIRILPRRGGTVFGFLEEGGEPVFECEFDSYKSAYWALMDMDGQEFLSRSQNTVSQNIVDKPGDSLLLSLGIEVPRKDS